MPSQAETLEHCVPFAKLKRNSLPSERTQERRLALLICQNRVIRDRDREREIKDKQRQVDESFRSKEKKTSENYDRTGTSHELDYLYFHPSIRHEHADTFHTPSTSIGVAPRRFLDRLTMPT